MGGSFGEKKEVLELHATLQFKTEGVSLENQSDCTMHSPLAAQLLQLPLFCPELCPHLPYIHPQFCSLLS